MARARDAAAAEQVALREGQGRLAEEIAALEAEAETARVAHASHLAMLRSQMAVLEAEREASLAAFRADVQWGEEELESTAAHLQADAARLASEKAEQGARLGAQ
eukprot:4757254-Prymnesium_polylepis.1